MDKPKLIYLGGPTGVGKTKASIYLAKMLDTEIISCDSMQVYRGMDIGTAKVTEDEADGIHHHMTDIVDPSQSYSVCDYVRGAAPIIKQLNNKGKVSLLVGGTGLYADSLIKGIDFATEAPVDIGYRQSLEELAQKEGKEYIHTMLSKVDSISADSIHPNNTKRVIRALEYYHLTGQTISSYNERTKSIESPYNSIRIYFTRDRQTLYSRIDVRVDQMIANGLVDEVADLIKSGVGLDTTSMQALGYKEIAGYLNNQISLDHAIELIKKGSRHYAKRQLTWFSRDKEGIWLNLDEFDSEEAVAKRCFELADQKFDLRRTI